MPDTAKTFDFTLYLGARVWRGGEFYIDPELDQGYGLGFPSPGFVTYTGTVGAAGFPSAEAYKVGSASSYSRVQRIFVRQTIDLGGPKQYVAPDENQLGESVDTRHLTLTAGEFSVTDVFDNNVYAHNPKSDFLNWSIVDMGAFDYAADAWGYTYGVSAELATDADTLRLGLFQLSTVPNQIAIEPTPFKEWSPIGEFERRTLFGGHPGAIKLLVYGDYGYMGTYAAAVAAAVATGTVPSTALVRTSQHWKIGEGLNIAQELAPHVGFFARASAMNGTYEAYDFTDIDRSLSTGISVDGGLYRRPHDTFGLATSYNAISTPAQQYFAAGGLGVLIGDGALSYAGERILETYYRFGFGQTAGFTFDYQHIDNPAYNVARGPISVYGVRYHIQY
jgi:high affinity Mn2+ porin